MKQEQAEIVKCKCGKLIAACVMGYQDAIWDKNRREYLSKGYEVTIIPAGDVKMESCACKKPVQLNIF